MSTTQNRLFTLLQDKMGIPQDLLTPDTTFEGLDLDSLALIELSVALQKEFGVLVEESEMGPDRSLTEVVSLLDSQLQAA